MTHEEDLLHKRMKRLLKVSNEKVEFKNYKDMCEKLKLPIKTSDSKKAQLKKLSYFCNLENGEKHSLYYTEVYNNPDNNILEEKFMVKGIETLLLSTFIKQEVSPPSIVLDTCSLWYLFGFINERFGRDNEERKFLSQNNISELHLYDFKRRARHRFENIITPALDKLEDRSLITYSSVKVIKIKTDYDVITRVATDEEISRILSYERKSLLKFGCDDINEIWNKSLEKEYYSYLNRLIRSKEEAQGWVKVSNGIKIVTNNKKWLRDGLNRNINELEVKYNINKEILNLLRQNAETRYANYIEQVQKEFSCFEKFGNDFDSVKHRLPTYEKRHQIMDDNYTASQEALMNYFIDVMPVRLNFD